MPTFYSPNGNPEIWTSKPDGYFTLEEWMAAKPAEEPETKRLAKVEAVKLELTNLDLASIRAIREIYNGTATQADHDRLRVIYEKAEKLRVELEKLTERANA